MKLHMTKETIEALRNKSINFEEIYGNEYDLWFDEITELSMRGDRKRLEELLGVFFSPLAKYLGIDDVEVSVVTSALMDKMGFNVNDAEYMLDFAIGAIIDDLEGINYTSTQGTEALREENISFYDVSL